MERPHLLGVLPEELSRWLDARGIRHTLRDARRLLAHFVSHGHDDLTTLPRLPRRVLDAVEQGVDRDGLRVVERACDPEDGFVKYLLQCPDEALTEAVRIPLHQAGRFALCLSSQVGCAMDCRFCATGRMGLIRQLETWEMVSAFRILRDEAPGRVTSALFQGQGEPLANYERVIHAARILSDPCGGRLTARAITVTTAGLPRQIRRFTAEGHKYRLIVSLNSAIAERRAELMPVAAKHDLEDLAAALREYAEASRQLPTVAWVMMAGVNTGDDEVQALSRLLAGVPLRLSLIDVNDARPDGYRPPGVDELERFRDALQVLRVPLVRRYSGGRAKHAACGMLASIRVGAGADSLPEPSPCS